jgi:hypothetical protein
MYIIINFGSHSPQGESQEAVQKDIVPLKKARRVKGQHYYVILPSPDGDVYCSVFYFKEHSLTSFARI